MELKKALDRFYYSTTLCDLRLMNEKLSDETITYNSLLYLELIFSMNGNCTASEIANLLYISKPAVTLKINELIKQGFVIKTANPKDKRQNLLSINRDMMPKYSVYRKQDSLAMEMIKKKYTKQEILKFAEMLELISDINFEQIK